MASSNDSSQHEEAYLPFDLLLSVVIPKLDERTIVTLRCVCRYFRSWISRDNPDFVTMYLSVQRQKPHFLLLSCRSIVDGGSDYHMMFYGYAVYIGLDSDVKWDEKQEIFSISFDDPINFCHVMCSRVQDEICIVDEFKCVRVYNITTKELISLPEWDWDSASVVALGWTSHYREHKVVRFFRRPVYPGEPRCKIFTLKKDTKWRRVEDPPFVIVIEYAHHYIPCVNGVLYVLAETYRQRVIDRQRILAAFDVEKESFQILPPPPCCLTCDTCYLTNSRKWLATLEGRLCMVDLCGGDTNGYGGTPATSLDLWTLVQGQEQFWIKQYTLDLSSLQSLRECKLPHLTPLFVNGYGILMRLSNTHLYYFYDFKNKRFSQANVLDRKYRQFLIDCHFYDLSSILPPGI